MVAETKKPPSAPLSVTDRDTQLGYRLGYSWSEKDDFELEIGRSRAEGGTRSPGLPAAARECLLNSRGPIRASISASECQGLPTGCYRDCYRKDPRRAIVRR